MIIELTHDASNEQVSGIERAVERQGKRARRISERMLVCTGENELNPAEVRGLAGVACVRQVPVPYPLVSRAIEPRDTIISLPNGVRIGGSDVVVMAGPCAVESREQVERIAGAVARAGAQVLRGGAYKPRTSPHSFQGLRELGLRYLRDAADRHGLAVVSEIMDVRTLDVMCEHVDILQVGARNMQNFDLLKELGRVAKPVLLKRGLSATLEELLLAAEYICAGGNTQVILCERGIRTFERATRNTLDLSAIPVLRGLTHLPVIVDPSHATGRRDLVACMSRAAVAVGADALIIEVHDRPETALCDGPQAISPEQLAALIDDARRVAEAVGRTVGAETGVALAA